MGRWSPPFFTCERVTDVPKFYGLGVLALVFGAGVAFGQGSQELDQDQTDACGAVMCLGGGSGVSECQPYLARFFSLWDQNPVTMVQRRQNYLDLCPGSDGSFNATAAQVGEQCQPEQLVTALNMELLQCAALWQCQGQTQAPARQGGRVDCSSCAARSPDRVQQVCGTWYSLENVVTKAPHLVASNCVPDAPGFDPGLGCTYTWVQTPATE